MPRYNFILSGYESNNIEMFLNLKSIALSWHVTILDKVKRKEKKGEKEKRLVEEWSSASTHELTLRINIYNTVLVLYCAVCCGC